MNIQSAIGFILGPVVMISCNILFMNGLISRYESLSARLRTLHAEHIKLLEAMRSNEASDNSHPQGALLCDFNRERLDEIEYQFHPLMQRHKLMNRAIVTLGVAISIDVLCMFVIGIHALTQIEWLQMLSLLLLLTGAGVFLIGVIITSLELTASPREVTYEVLHGLKLSR